MTLKYCPFEECNHRHNVSFNPVTDPSPSIGVCPKCGQKYDIITMLGDSRKAGKAGGFKLVKPFKPNVDITEILRFIQKSKRTHAPQIAREFRKPETTIRGYLVKLENDGLITREPWRRYKIVCITEYGKQVLA